MPRSASLDGLRGFAVLIVLASHFSNAGLLPTRWAAGAGKAGVYLFFVLSAFLLTSAIVTMPPGKLREADTWIDYVCRRILRIWPLYLLVLLLSWFLTVQGIRWHYVIDTRALVAHLMLREGYSALWSIPVEFTFYAILPLLAVAMRWLVRRRHGTVGMLLIGAALLGGVQWYWPASQAEVNDVRLGPYLPVFICGVLAAGLSARIGASGVRRRAMWGVAGVLALLAFVMTVPSVWSTVTARPFTPDVGHRWFLGYGVLWATLLLALLHGPRALAAAFESRPMRVLGWISYSVYLWHLPIVDAVRLSLPNSSPTRAAIAVAGIAGGAAVSYLLVERPFQRIRWRRRATALSAGPEGARW